MDFWPLIVVIGAVVTGYLQMRMTVEELKTDIEIQRSKRDELMTRMNEKINADHDLLIRHDEDLRIAKSAVKD